MIVKARQAVYDNLSTALSVRVHRTAPDDVPGTPSVILGRPSIGISQEVPGSYAIGLDVFVLGDRSQSPDNVDELEALAWDAVTALDYAQLPLMHSCEVESCNPQVVPVAGLDYPCYVIRLAIHTSTCR